METDQGQKTSLCTVLLCSELVTSKVKRRYTNKKFNNTPMYFTLKWNAEINHSERLYIKIVGHYVMAAKTQLIGSEISPWSKVLF
jgi:hypothetical protein